MFEKKRLKWLSRASGKDGKIPCNGSTGKGFPVQNGLFLAAPENTGSFRCAVRVVLKRTASCFSYFHYHCDLLLDDFRHFIKITFDLSFFLFFKTALNDENAHFYSAQNVTEFSAVNSSFISVFALFHRSIVHLFSFCQDGWHKVSAR